MARAICPQAGLTGMINLNPSRCALKRIGGVDRTMYVGSLSELAGFTRDAEGYIKTLTMKASMYLYALNGKKLKNSHSTEIRQSENATLFGQTVNFVAYFDTQPEKDAIELLIQSDDLFVILQNKYGRFEAFGLVGQEGIPAEGMGISAGTYAVEAASDGASSMLLTFTADESKLPVYTNFGDDAIEEIAYLDALVLP
jgi:hypothetical protein